MYALLQSWSLAFLEGGWQRPGSTKRFETIDPSSRLRRCDQVRLRTPVPSRKHCPRQRDRGLLVGTLPSERRFVVLVFDSPSISEPALQGGTHVGDRGR
jgi:hypothetical protein